MSTLDIIRDPMRYSGDNASLDLDDDDLQYTDDGQEPCNQREDQEDSDTDDECSIQGLPQLAPAHTHIAISIYIIRIVSKHVEVWSGRSVTRQPAGQQ